MTRFNDTKNSAIVVSSEILSKQTIVPELQHDLADEEKTLEETAAGSFITGNISEAKA